MSFAPWIKIEITTPDKPEVVAMATRLRMKDQDTVTGKLVRLWAWADQNSVDGRACRITRAFVDRLVACQGFAGALEAEGWLTGPDGAIDFPGFDRHNGDSAKKRAGEARKKQNQRAGGKGSTSGKGTDVPQPSGQRGGPEIELDFLERESGRDALGEKILAAGPDPLLERVRGLRPEYGAPALDPRERKAWGENRPVLESFDGETWEAMRDYLAVRHFPAGSVVYQPEQRLQFIVSANDVAGKALAWRGKKPGPVEAKPWPVSFEAWAKERFPSMPARSLWGTPSMRKQWEESEEGGQDAA